MPPSYVGFMLRLDFDPSICSSETSISFRTTRRYYVKSHTLQKCKCSSVGVLAILHAQLLVLSVCWTHPSTWLFCFFTWQRKHIRFLKRRIFSEYQTIGKVQKLSWTMNARLRIVTLGFHFQTGSRANPTSYPMGTGGSFPGCKAAGAWSWSWTSN
jgi:hypothetical protein